MAKSSKRQGAIPCKVTRRYLRNGSNKASVQGVRVSITHGQKTELEDMARAINHANSATVADVLAVWNAMEEEIIRALEDGRRVALGNLGTLRLEVGTKPGKSTAKSITSSDIVAKGLTFQPSKRLTQVIDSLTFECDGIVKHPLSNQHSEEALAQHFASHPYISVRTYATLTHCSLSTARRRIAEMVTTGRLIKSGIARGVYQIKGEG